MRIFSVLVLASTFSVPAFAADLGTYRPGAPYHSVIAPSADICQNQCDGDAQCRGWNYVKVNPRAPGVCEFNSKPANPIESVISISGEGASLIAPNISVGSTNTVRVGTSSSPKPRASVRQSSPNRRVIRQVVPQQIRPEQAVARGPISNHPVLHHSGPNQFVQGGSLKNQQNFQRQQTGHLPLQVRNPNVPNAVQQQAALPQYPQTHPRVQARQQVRPQLPQQRLLRDPRVQYPQSGRVPGFSHNLDGAPQQLKQFQQRQILQQRQIPQGRPPLGVPITAPAPQASQPTASVNTPPVNHQNVHARIQESQIAAAPRSAQFRGSSVEQAQASLFGNLNDDVIVPRPLLSLPRDKNAPIATSQSRPSIPVVQEPLGVLAGG